MDEGREGGGSFLKWKLRRHTSGGLSDFCGGRRSGGCQRPTVRSVCVCVWVVGGGGQGRTEQEREKERAVSQGREGEIRKMG